MKTPLVAGNWKMNGDLASVDRLVDELVEAFEPSQCEMLVCPPAVYLERVGAKLAGSVVQLGAQNVDWHESGAFTGEIAVPMIRELGCRYALVGHSERRTHYGETDEVVSTKAAACVDGDVVPVICVGETLEERRAGDARNVVERQLQAVVDRVDGVFARAVIAYEPVWAIGTGETASPEQADEVHGWIRELIDRSGGPAAETRILYGGSVNAANASELFAKENIDGALVGGASLKSADFLSICGSAGGGH